MIRLRIKEVAKSRGINQSQLQIKAGVTPQLLNRYWNNHTQSAAFEPLEKIANALNVSPAELIEVVGDGTKIDEVKDEEDDAA